MNLDVMDVIEEICFRVSVGKKGPELRKGTMGIERVYCECNNPKYIGTDLFRFGLECVTKSGIQRSIKQFVQWWPSYERGRKWMFLECYRSHDN